MMAYSSQGNPEIQRPVSTTLIVLSILLALFLNGLPLKGALLMLRPDFVAVVMLYWCVHKPLRVGIGLSWMVGIFADVIDASLFGQHALAYTMLAFGGTALHHRLKMFDPRQQTTQVFFLLALNYLAYALVHWLVNGYVIWQYFLGCFTSTLLWVPLCIMLQAAQRIHADR